MTKTKTLFLGPVVYLLGIAALVAVVSAVSGAFDLVSLSLSDIFPATEGLGDSGLFYFLAFAVPAVTAGAMTAPPEGPKRWFSAVGHGMIATALMVVPAIGLMVYHLPSLLDGSIGEGGLVLIVLAYFTATQLMSGFGGVLRYGWARRRIGTTA